LELAGDFSEVWQGKELGNRGRGMGVRPEKKLGNRGE
jgi:hypothetical protein